MRIPRRIWRHLGLVSLLSIVVAAMGIGSTAVARSVAAQRQTDGEFIGRTDNPDLFVGVITDGANVFAFVCDGTEAGVSRWGWFRGTASQGDAQLTDANGNALAIRLTGDAVAGSVTFGDGVTNSFQLEKAVREAGLFRLETTVGNDTVVGGWIVLPDGDLRGQLQRRPVMAAPAQTAGGSSAFIGTGNFNPQTGTASIKDGTSNTIVMPTRLTPGIIAILIG